MVSPKKLRAKSPIFKGLVAVGATLALLGCDTHRSGNGPSAGAQTKSPAPSLQKRRQIEEANQRVLETEGFNMAANYLIEVLHEHPVQGRLLDGRSCEVRLHRTIDSQGKVVGVNVQMTLAQKNEGKFHSLALRIESDSVDKITTVISSSRVTIHHAFKAFDLNMGEYDGSDFISFSYAPDGQIKAIDLYQAEKIESLQAIATCILR